MLLKVNLKINCIFMVQLAAAWYQLQKPYSAVIQLSISALATTLKLNSTMNLNQIFLCVPRTNM